MKAAEEVGLIDSMNKHVKISGLDNVIPIPARLLDYKCNSEHLQITNGTYFIGDSKEDGTINVLNGDLDVGESLAYKYMWATIATKHERLMIWRLSGRKVTSRNQLCTAAAKPSTSATIYKLSLLIITIL